MAEVRITIGIDPGVTTGYAVYDHDTEHIRYVKTLDFWSCLEEMKGWDTEVVKIIIEAPIKTAMYARQVGATEGKAAGYGNRMMSNAASNAREAELLADGIEKLGFIVQRVRPSRHKWKQEDLLENTNYTERTNQHVRDAIQLCYGK